MKMNTKFKVGDRIKELRTFHNLSQAEFALRAKMSRSSLSEIESNKYAISSDKLLVICEYFGVSSEWLLLGNGEMYPTKDEDYIELPSKEVLESVLQKGEDLKKNIAAIFRLSMPETNDLVDIMRNNDNNEALKLFIKAAQGDQQAIKDLTIKLLSK